MKKFKRFMIFIIIIVILGGGFYLGWIQFKLDENDYAVVFTKIGGYDDEVLEPGKFIWMWENLIPTNMKLHIFNLNPRQKSLSLSGTLPSGEVYREVLEGNPSFDYSFQFDITYRLNPAHLPELAEGGFLTPENIDTWYSRFEDNFTLKAVDFLKKEASKPEFYISDGKNSSFIEDKLTDHLSPLFPDVELMSIVPTEFQIPDADLYQAGKDEYFSLIDEKHEINLEIIREAAGRTMNETANLELLGKYGELLTTYPILIEYLDKNPVLSEELIISLQGE